MPPIKRCGLKRMLGSPLPPQKEYVPPNPNFLTFKSALSSQIEIGLCIIPRLPVRLIDLTAETRYTSINSVKEVESHLKIFDEVDAVGEILADIGRFLSFSNFGLQFYSQEIVKVGLYGDTKTNVNICRKWETKPLADSVKNVGKPYLRPISPKSSRLRLT